MCVGLYLRSVLFTLTDNDTLKDRITTGKFLSHIEYSRIVRKRKFVDLFEYGKQQHIIKLLLCIKNKTLVFMSILMYLYLKSVSLQSF